MEISKIILTYLDVKVHILSVKEVNIFSDYYRSSFSKEIQKQDHVFKPNNRYPKIPFYLRYPVGNRRKSSFSRNSYVVGICIICTQD